MAIENLIQQRDQKLVVKGTYESQIQHAITNLRETDYKVIKIYEAKILEQVEPYDVKELFTLRESWRSEINSLENKIKLIDYEIQKIEEEIIKLKNA